MPTNPYGPEWADWSFPDNTGFGGGATGDFTMGAARSNENALPHIAQLTQLINSINQTAQQASNAGRIPGGRGLEGVSSGNIQRALTGQLDPSVITQISQGAAERGVGTGSPMGAGSNAAYLRALGLNALDLMNTGQDWLTKANARNPGAPIFDPSSLLLTPAQYGGLELERSRLPRAGGGGLSPSYFGGGGGGVPRRTTAAASPGLGVNWADLFGGGPTGSYYSQPVDTFPWGTGTGGGTPADVVYTGGFSPLDFSPDQPLGTKAGADFSGNEVSTYDPYAEFFDESVYQ